MSMFKELYELALGATLTLTISADEKKGRMTVNVIPKPRDDVGEPALSTPLVLTATPEEFDADFVTVLAGYRTSHASLVQQAQVTQELLDAAKAASAKKATGAVAKAQTKSASPAAAARRATGSAPASEPDAADDGAGDGDDEAEASASTPAASNTEPQLFG
ncbi:PRTRC system protein E [uncultured Methylibium sp.]|uniref:PRTRC system protein E n=1 Tax=uncultured Methylibium sp. TaxID=381093 RepID=UPI0025E5327B|nr:PRTRC system protein E [uncultured Methylibium sp.]